MSARERRIAQARLAVDAGEADQDNEEDSYVLSCTLPRFFSNIFRSPVHGLVLAVKDPRVWLFALLNVSQLLGLSFTNFFPTCVPFLSHMSDYPEFATRLTQTLGYNTTISLLLAAYVML